MELLKDYLAGFLQRATKQEVTEYQFYVNEIRKMTGEKYIVLHMRLARAFGEKSVDYLLSNIKLWFYEAEKVRGIAPGIVFNARFKQWREAQIKHE